MSGTSGNLHLQAAAPPVVLASSSPTRAAMLRAAGVAFTIAAPAVDEPALRETLAAERASTRVAATALAELKAASIARRWPGDALVIGADQLLDLDGAWLEKPTDLAALRRQLLQLRARRHLLVSAAVAFRGSVRVWAAVDSATIALRDFSPTMLEAYIATAATDGLDSVGGYRIEGIGLQLMSEVAGDYFTVLGLPLLPLLAFLRDHGVLLP